MKVLFAGFKNEYGNPAWGLSTIEYQNFFGTLSRMPGVEAEFFAVDEIMAAAGRDAMNQKLVATVSEHQPALLFTMIFSEEIKKQTIDYITKNTVTKTLNWFTDDHWRFPVYSRYWAPLFSAVATTDSQALAKYQALGIKNVIKTQWAANQYLYKQNELKVENQKLKGIDITFVGKNYGVRSKYIKELAARGLSAKGFGKGWDGGVVDFSTMLEIFSQSKINLNFTESPYVAAKDRLKLFAKLFVKREMGYYRFNAHRFVPNLRSAIGSQRRQIKARIFEISACGGFLLTGDADNLADYYLPGKELAIFKTAGELEDKCRYYLSHGQERAAIAKAGYERTIREHSYEQRFIEIFKAMDLWLAS